jgi:hypothetical protein
VIKSLYVIGSLRNPGIPVFATALRKHGIDVFDDWFAAGPKADDHWKEYEVARGRTYPEALAGYPAGQVFRYDKSHLDRCQAAVLVLPAGKSGHLELGYFIGSGKPGFILKPADDDRWDVMYRFANKVVFSVDELVHELGKL